MSAETFALFPVPEGRRNADDMGLPGPAVFDTSSVDPVYHHVVGLQGIARICHEANRAYCESLHDNSQPPWEQAPEWQRESAIEGVRAHLEAGGLSPAKSHALWMERKVTEGWRWGLKKDAVKKTHPCLVPYDQLPQTQRAKDYIFAAIVRCFLAARPDKDAA